jgi:acid phosphatase type 7
VRALVLALLPGCHCSEPPTDPSYSPEPLVAEPLDAAAPPDAAAAPAVVIAAAGDIAGRINRHRATANLLLGLARREPLAALLPLGDLQYPKGDYADFLAYYHLSWGHPTLRAITRPVPGNHEYDQGRSDASGYFDYFNGPGRSSGVAGERHKGYYSFDLGGWHLVALNSSDGCRRVPCAAGSEMHRWLVQDLERHPRKCVLAYWHHPRFQVGNHADNRAVAPLWEALHDAGADVVLNGHDHNFQQLARLDKRGRLDPEHGIRSFVVGTGGAPAYTRFDHTFHPGAGEAVLASRAGVLLLTLEPGAYRWRFVAADTVEGRVLAEGRDVCR